MKTLIIGPGAIGCLLAARLSTHSESLFLLDKNREREEKIKKNGITVEEISGEIKNYKDIDITCSPLDLREKFNIIIIATKSYDTFSAITSIKNILSEDVGILTLQNGLNNVNTIKKVIGKKGKIFAGITSIGITNLSPGNIKVAGSGETLIAPVNKEDRKYAEQIVNFFNQCKIETKINNNAESLIWSKLLINIGINAPAAILKIKNGELLDCEFTKKIMYLAGKEGYKIASAKKIKLLYSSVQKKLDEVCKKTSNNINSLLQDILKGKKTEIEYLNGAIAKEGRKLKIKTPVNDLLTYLILAIETRK